MAQVLKEDIEKRILKYAVEEFFNRDYRTTKMRTIAENAGIPTGLIYSYFQNKEDLFEAVVQPTYNYLGSLANDGTSLSESHFENFFLKEAEHLLTMLKTNRKQFIILVDKSSGTKYENSAENLVELTKAHIKDHLSKKMEKSSTVLDDVFFHILANNFVEGLIEIARHYRDDEWARNTIKLLGLQYFYGINAFV